MSEGAVNDEDAVVATALDYFEGWYDADLTRIDRAPRSAQYREHLHPLRTPEGWRIINAFWNLTDPDRGASG